MGGGRGVRSKGAKLRFWESPLPELCSDVLMKLAARRKLALCVAILEGNEGRDKDLVPSEDLHLEVGLELVEGHGFADLEAHPVDIDHEEPDFIAADPEPFPSALQPRRKLPEPGVIVELCIRKSFCHSPTPK